MLLAAEEQFVKELYGNKLKQEQAAMLGKEMWKKVEIAKKREEWTEVQVIKKKYRKLMELV